MKYSWGHGKPVDQPWNTSFSFNPSNPIKLPPGTVNHPTALPHPDFIEIAVFEAPREGIFMFSLTASMVELREPRAILSPSLVPSPYVQVNVFLHSYIMDNYYSGQSLVVEQGRAATMNKNKKMKIGDYEKLYLNQLLKDGISEIRNTVNLGDLTLCVIGFY